ncbi:MAG: hypothetical protein K2Q18_06655 [Bdellovibrionales bacterium]|nr:hypothetical protein [Bdellovibrionales bacterium]
MNSNFFFLILILLISSCGVKAPPLKYPETIVDSYTRSYTGGDPTPEELERIKNESVIPSAVDPKKNTVDPTPVKP